MPSLPRPSRQGALSLVLSARVGGGSYGKFVRFGVLGLGFRVRGVVFGASFSEAWDLGLQFMLGCLGLLLAGWGASA